MKDIWLRFTGNLLERVGGPLTFRFVLQPLVASLVGVRAGLRDAREGLPSYLWTVFTYSGQRSHALRDGGREIARVFVLAAAIDLIYQAAVLRWFYPLEALVVAAVAAIVPYLLARGLTNRLARRKTHVR
jgi:hypothetical protein